MKNSYNKKLFTHPRWTEAPVAEVIGKREPQTLEEAEKSRLKLEEMIKKFNPKKNTDE